MPTINSRDLIYFILVSMRITGMIAFNPILGRRNIPTMVKSGMVILFSYIIFSSTEPVTVMADTIFELVFLLLKEFVIGFILGFVITLFTVVLIYGGELMDLEMGLAMSKVFDPQSNASISIMGTFFNGIFMLLFFAVNGHLALIKIILTSGETVPYGAVSVSPEIAWVMVDIFVQSIHLGVQFAMPILVAELVAEIGVGMLMKTIPQINVFVVNIQLKLFIGFALIFIYSTAFASYLEQILSIMLDTVKNTLPYL